ncbi:hypothetical protein RSP03_37650 [Cereibacter sphaeroides]|nr:hypothetical protein RSP03_37650 [Cereibacter sphaeroides]
MAAVDVIIGAADPHLQDPDPDVARLGFGAGAILLLEPAGFDADEGFHQAHGTLSHGREAVRRRGGLSAAGVFYLIRTVRVKSIPADGPRAKGKAWRATGTCSRCW